MPERIFDMPTLMRFARVSFNFPDVTQQIHSFLAKGVMSTHSAATFLSPAIIFFKSAGNLCTVPPEIVPIT